MSEQSIDSLRAATADRYTIERELGRGGMATVYLARDLKHDRPVALKVMHPELAASIGADRFLREIRVAARIQHPNAVPVFDSGGDGAVLWYTMPYVAGESLRDRLDRDARLPVAEAVAITRQIAGALAAAHADGIVHRDIKPENILLRDGHAMLADFGIAQAAWRSDALTGTGMSLGTPAYMSPEQVSGDPIDGRSDVFSLGCVLYEMLTGRQPFIGPTLQAQLMSRLVDRVTPVRTLRPEVPPQLEVTLDRAMAAEPNERFAGAGEFAAALDGAPVSARAGTNASSSWRHWTRRRAVLLVAAALALVLGAFATRSLARDGRAVARDDRSLAVLEFRNRSPDSADAFLASGLTEEVSSRLGDIRRLRVKGSRAVTSLTSAPTVDYQKVGRALGVRYLVDGSVRRAAHRVKITVQLVTAVDGFQVWSQDYDGASGDVMELQEEIARNVARQIAGELLSEEQTALGARGTDDPGAYEHFLRGNYLLAQRSAAATARAIAQYDSALARDAAFTRARARSAYAHAQILDWGWTLPGVSDAVVLERGLAASARALEEDSTAAEAWLARGYLLTFADPQRFAGVEDALSRAIALDSMNAEAHHQFGWVLHQLGHDARALEEYHRALALEPDRPSTLRLIGLVHLFAGRYAEAERWLDSTLNVDPSFYSAYGLRGLARMQRGDVAGARADGEMSLRLRPDDPLRGEFVLALADAASGAAKSARERIDGMLDHVGEGPVNVWDAMYLAIALLGAGDREAAGNVVKRVPERGVVRQFAFRAPLLDALRIAR